MKTNAMISATYTVKTFRLKYFITFLHNIPISKKYITVFAIVNSPFANMEYVVTANPIPGIA